MVKLIFLSTHGGHDLNINTAFFQLNFWQFLDVFF